MFSDKGTQLRFSKQIKSIIFKEDSAISCAVPINRVLLLVAYTIQLITFFETWTRVTTPIRFQISLTFFPDSASIFLDRINVLTLILLWQYIIMPTRSRSSNLLDIVITLFYQTTKPGLPDRHPRPGFAEDLRTTDSRNSAG